MEMTLMQINVANRLLFVLFNAIAQRQTLQYHLLVKAINVS